MSNAVGEIDHEANQQPNGETDPSVDVQLEHEVDVDQDTQHGDERHQRDFEGDLGLFGGLTRDDQEQDQDRHGQYGQDRQVQRILSGEVVLGVDQNGTDDAGDQG